MGNPPTPISGEGWKLLPAEATPEMIEAGEAVAYEGNPHSGHDAGGIWHAMSKVAPAMPAASLIGDALAKCGWIPHQGEPCPVSPDSFPLVLCADGTTDCERASDFDWTWSDPQYPSSWVIAYRDEKTL